MARGWWIAGLVSKAVAVAVMIAAPLAGVWIASSLAAYANRATWPPVAAGLLLFPLLPMLWEAVAAWRARRRGKPRVLTLSDRLILRTLAINAVFLTVLLAAFPTRAFVALSARGDWMLDGRRGAAADSLRGKLRAAAGGLEWLYRASRDNPYREHGEEPVPAPAPSGAAPAPASSAGTPAPAPAEPAPAARATPTQRYPWPATLHPLVASMPPEAEASIAGVGRYIAEREPDPALRIKALHDWVADRIAYDAEAFAENRIRPEHGDADATFRSRKAVCAGYARLLAELGKVTGDRIWYVVGDARSANAPLEGEPHAWNVASIEGALYLIDATWNAGSVRGSSFEKAYSSEFLFTPPALFAITHFPDSPEWQLQEPPLSRVEFFQRPPLAPAFFAHGLVLKSPDRSQVSVSRSLRIELENPREAFLIAHSRPKAGGEDVDCAGVGRAAFRCDFPRQGSYDVQLFVNAKQYGRYDFAGSVQVNANP